MCVCVAMFNDLLYSGKVYRVESLANLVNRLRFTRLKPSKVVVIINNALADTNIMHKLFCSCQ